MSSGSDTIIRKFMYYVNKVKINERFFMKLSFFLSKVKLYSLIMIYVYNNKLIRL